MDLSKQLIDNIQSIIGKDCAGIAFSIKHNELDPIRNKWDYLLNIELIFDMNEYATTSKPKMIKLEYGEKSDGSIIGDTIH